MKALRHFITITKHRLTVMKYCFKVGLYRQGLTHDLSKYSPAEFFVGARYYLGFRSPNTAERRERGYSSAWLHHKGRNKHHYEYWTDFGMDPKEGYKPLEMPPNYLVEMFFDRIAACKTYKGREYTDSCPLDYFLNAGDSRLMHPGTHEDLLRLLRMLAEDGEKATLDYIRREVLSLRSASNI